MSCVARRLPDLANVHEGCRRRTAGQAKPCVARGDSELPAAAAKQHILRTPWCACNTMHAMDARGALLQCQRSTDNDGMSRILRREAEGGPSCVCPLPRIGRQSQRGRRS
jgi:hypothetical protein